MGDFKSKTYHKKKPWPNDKKAIVFFFFFKKKSSHSKRNQEYFFLSHSIWCFLFLHKCHKKSHQTLCIPAHISSLFFFFFPFPGRGGCMNPSHLLLLLCAPPNPPPHSIYTYVTFITTFSTPAARILSLYPLSLTVNTHLT